MVLMHKHTFVNEFFIQQVYNRVTSTEYGLGVNEAQSLTAGFFFIGKTILKGFYPWVIAVAAVFSLGIFSDPPIGEKTDESFCSYGS